MKSKDTALLTGRKYRIKLVPWFKYIEHGEGIWKRRSMAPSVLDFLTKSK